LQRLGGNDQVGGRASLRGHVHLGEPVAVCRHHAHPVGAQLPEHAVQDRAALLGGRRERHVPDELVYHSGRRLPGAVELDGRHRAQAFLQLFPSDRELHPPCRLVSWWVKNLLLYYYRTTSSSSRGRGNVGESG